MTRATFTFNLTDQQVSLATTEVVREDGVTERQVWPLVLAWTNEQGALRGKAFDGTDVTIPADVLAGHDTAVSYHRWEKAALAAEAQSSVAWTPEWWAVA